MIDSQEFFNCLKDNGAELSQAECDSALGYFDTNKNGMIDYNEFINGVYGNMSEAKKNKIQEVFNKLDKEGKGVLSAVNLKIAYNS